MSVGVRASFNINRCVESTILSESSCCRKDTGDFRHCTADALSRRQTQTMNQNKAVPYFVLNLYGDRVKALFVVSSDSAETLIMHPILCRGASFDLNIDTVSQTPEMRFAARNSGSSFLSTEFSSPNPEETARAIAERLAIRQESPPPNLSHLFG